MEFCYVQISLCVQVLHSRILAALLHGTPAAGLCGMVQGMELRNICTGCILSAGRPSRWASAHILVVNVMWPHFYQSAENVIIGHMTNISFVSIESHICSRSLALTVQIGILCTGISEVFPSVLWRCWMGVRKGIRPVKTEWWLVRYWRGYLSGARCKWFAYGPADCTAIPSSLAPVKSRMVYLSGAGLPRLYWKKPVKWM